MVLYLALRGEKLMKLKYLVLCLLLLCGCQKVDNNDGDNNVTLQSLEELSERADAAFIKPSDVNISNESFKISGKFIAEYAFEVDGVPCVLRQANKEANVDISGMPLEIAFTNDETSLFPMYTANTTYKACRWFTLDGQYTFIAKDGESWPFETFESLCIQFQNAKPKNWVNASLFERYNALDGIYLDGEHSVFVCIVQDQLKLSTSIGDTTYECSIEYINNQYYCRDLEMTKVVQEEDGAIITTKTTFVTPRLTLVHFEDNTLVLEGEFFGELQGIVFEPYFSF